MRLDGSVIQTHTLFTWTTGTPAFGTHDVPRFFRHEPVRGVQCEGNNGLLSVLQEGAHHTRGKAAPKLATATATTTSLERRIQNRTYGGIVGSRGHPAIRGVPLQLIGVEKLLGCCKTSTNFAMCAAMCAAMSASSADHVLYWFPKNDERFPDL